jgi:hypothetical protein
MECIKPSGGTLYESKTVTTTVTVPANVANGQIQNIGLVVNSYQSVSSSCTLSSKASNLLMFLYRIECAETSTYPSSSSTIVIGTSPFGNASAIYTTTLKAGNTYTATYYLGDSNGQNRDFSLTFASNGKTVTATIANSSTDFRSNPTIMIIYVVGL